MFYFVLLLLTLSAVQCQDRVHSTVCPHLDKDCVSTEDQYDGEADKRMEPWTLCLSEAYNGGILEISIHVHIVTESIMKEDSEYNISVSLKYQNSFKRLVEVSDRDATSYYKNSSHICYKITVVICEASILDQHLIKVNSTIDHWTVNVVNASFINASTLKGSDLNHTFQARGDSESYQTWEILFDTATISPGTSKVITALYPTPSAVISKVMPKALDVILSTMFPIQSSTTPVLEIERECEFSCLADNILCRCRKIRNCSSLYSVRVRDIICTSCLNIQSTSENQCFTLNNFCACSTLSSIPRSMKHIPDLLPSSNLASIDSTIVPVITFYSQSTINPSSTMAELTQNSLSLDSSNAMPRPTHTTPGIDLQPTPTTSPEIQRVCHFSCTNQTGYYCKCRKIRTCNFVYTKRVETLICESCLADFNSDSDEKCYTLNDFCVCGQGLSSSAPTPESSAIPGAFSTESIVTPTGVLLPPVQTPISITEASISPSTPFQILSSHSSTIAIYSPGSTPSSVLPTPELPDEIQRECEFTCGNTNYQCRCRKIRNCTAVYSMMVQEIICDSCFMSEINYSQCFTLNGFCMCDAFAPSTFTTLAPSTTTPILAFPTNMASVDIANSYSYSQSMLAMFPLPLFPTQSKIPPTSFDAMLSLMFMTTSIDLHPTPTSSPERKSECQFMCTNQSNYFCTCQSFHTCDSVYTERVEQLICKSCLTSIHRDERECVALNDFCVCGPKPSSSVLSPVPHTPFPTPSPEFSFDTLTPVVASTVTPTGVFSSADSSMQPPPLSTDITVSTLLPQPTPELPSEIERECEFTCSNSCLNYQCRCRKIRNCTTVYSTKVQDIICDSCVMSKRNCSKCFTLNNFCICDAFPQMASPTIAPSSVQGTPVLAFPTNLVSVETIVPVTQEVATDTTVTPSTTTPQEEHSSISLMTSKFQDSSIDTSKPEIPPNLVSISMLSIAPSTGVPTDLQPTPNARAATCIIECINSMNDYFCVCQNFHTCSAVYTPRVQNIICNSCLDKLNIDKCSTLNNFCECNRRLVTSLPLQLTQTVFLTSHFTEQTSATLLPTPVLTSREILTPALPTSIPSLTIPDETVISPSPVSTSSIPGEKVITSFLDEIITDMLSTQVSIKDDTLSVIPTLILTSSFQDEIQTTIFPTPEAESSTQDGILTTIIPSPVLASDEIQATLLSTQANTLDEISTTMINEDEMPTTVVFSPLLTSSLQDEVLTTMFSTQVTTQKEISTTIFPTPEPESSTQDGILTTIIPSPVLASDEIQATLLSTQANTQDEISTTMINEDEMSTTVVFSPLPTSSLQDEVLTTMLPTEVSTPIIMISTPESMSSVQDEILTTIIPTPVLTSSQDETLTTLFSTQLSTQNEIFITTMFSGVQDEMLTTLIPTTSSLENEILTTMLFTQASTQGEILTTMIPTPVSTSQDEILTTMQVNTQEKFPRTMIPDHEVLTTMIPTQVQASSVQDELLTTQTEILTTMIPIPELTSSAQDEKLTTMLFTQASIQDEISTIIIPTQVITSSLQDEVALTSSFEDEVLTTMLSTEASTQDAISPTMIVLPSSLQDKILTTMIPTPGFISSLEDEIMTTMLSIPVMTPTSLTSSLQDQTLTTMLSTQASTQDEISTTIIPTPVLTSSLEDEMLTTMFYFPQSTSSLQDEILTTGLSTQESTQNKISMTIVSEILTTMIPTTVSTFSLEDEILTTLLSTQASAQDEILTTMIPMPVSTSSFDEILTTMIPTPVSTSSLQDEILTTLIPTPVLTSSLQDEILTTMIPTTISTSDEIITTMIPIPVLTSSLQDEILTTMMPTVSMFSLEDEILTTMFSTPAQDKTMIPTPDLTSSLQDEILTTMIPTTVSMSSLEDEILPSTQASTQEILTTMILTPILTSSFEDATVLSTAALMSSLQDEILTTMLSTQVSTQDELLTTMIPTQVLTSSLQDEILTTIISTPVSSLEDEIMTIQVSTQDELSSTITPASLTSNLQDEILSTMLSTQGSAQDEISTTILSSSLEIEMLTTMFFSPQLTSSLEDEVLTAGLSTQVSTQNEITIMSSLQDAILTTMIPNTVLTSSLQDEILATLFYTEASTQDEILTTMIPTPVSTSSVEDEMLIAMFSTPALLSSLQDEILTTMIPTTELTFSPQDEILATLLSTEASTQDKILTMMIPTPVLTPSLEDEMLSAMFSTPALLSSLQDEILTTLIPTTVLTFSLEHEILTTMLSTQASTLDEILTTVIPTPVLSSNLQDKILTTKIPTPVSMSSLEDEILTTLIPTSVLMSSLQDEILTTMTHTTVSTSSEDEMLTTMLSTQASTQDEILTIMIPTPVLTSSQDKILTTMITTPVSMSSLEDEILTTMIPTPVLTSSLQDEILTTMTPTTVSMSSEDGMLTTMLSTQASTQEEILTTMIPIPVLTSSLQDMILTTMITTPLEDEILTTMILTPVLTSSLQDEILTTIIPNTVSTSSLEDEILTTMLSTQASTQDEILTTMIPTPSSLEDKMLTTMSEFMSSLQDEISTTMISAQVSTQDELLTTMIATPVLTSSLQDEIPTSMIFTQVLTSSFQDEILTTTMSSIQVTTQDLLTTITIPTPVLTSSAQDEMLSIQVSTQDELSSTTISTTAVVMSSFQDKVSTTTLPTSVLMSSIQDEIRTSTASSLQNEIMTTILPTQMSIQIEGSTALAPSPKLISSNENNVMTTTMLTSSIRLTAILPTPMVMPTTSFPVPEILTTSSLFQTLMTILEDNGLDTDALETSLNTTSLFPTSDTINNSAIVATQLLEALDVVALRFLPVGSYSLPNSRLEVRNVSTTFPVIALSSGNSSIVLPPQILNISDSDTVRIASYFFEDPMLPNNFKDDIEVSLVSPVISSALLCAGGTVCDTSSVQTQEPVRIQLEHMGKVNSTSTFMCAFWEFLRDESGNLIGGRWSTDGCNLTERNSNVTLCECNHLTHFGILLSPGLDGISKENELALRTIGYIGVSASLITLTVTVIILICIKSLKSLRNYIHIHLCITLMVSQVVFVAGIDKTSNTDACSVVAVLLHYLYLVSFMWMLMEGVVLYVVLVKVFIQKVKKLYLILFTVLSYGLPLLYMGLTIPLGFLLHEERDYGYEAACWLRYTTNFIWTFIAPVIAIILINTGFFAMAIFIMCKQRAKVTSKSKIKATKQWVKSSISLVVVMGLTWIVGVLAFDSKLLPFAYIFTIFIAFQGVAIFIIFIVLSKQVQTALLEWLRTKVNNSSWLGNTKFSDKVNRLANKSRNSSHPEASTKASKVQMGSVARESTSGKFSRNL